MSTAAIDPPPLLLARAPTGLADIEVGASEPGDSETEPVADDEGSAGPLLTGGVVTSAEAGGRTGCGTADTVLAGGLEVTRGTAVVCGGAGTTGGAAVVGGAGGLQIWL
jgi:hypothetical protein